MNSDISQIQLWTSQLPGTDRYMPGYVKELLKSTSDWNNLGNWASAFVGINNELQKIYSHFDQIRVLYDLTTGLSSGDGQKDGTNTSSWDQAKTVPVSNEKFDSLYFDNFSKALFDSNIDDESIDYLESEVSRLMAINRDATLLMIQRIYTGYLESDGDNISLALKILRIIQRFEYKDMSPYTQLIVSSAIHSNNPRIQLDALEVVDRWGNREALNILEKMECPSHPWGRAKYNSLLKTLRNDLSEGA